jgi:prepilin-type N-terminal cleavage/methylation domain-containing protein
MKRRGFTLVEFLISAALAGVVSAAIATTFVRQQHFHSARQERLVIRGRLSEAANILATELRSASLGELGVRSMSDSAIEVFLPVMTSVACTVSGAAVGLAPALLARGNTLTSGSAQPDTGDIALIYGIPYNFPDSGSWTQYRISGVTSRAASSMCPAATGFTTSGDVTTGTSAWQVTLATSPSPVIRAGSPMHFARRGRYSLYKSSGEWYLGYRRCNALGTSVCGSIQPVSGPYLPYSSGGVGGLFLSYYNKTGALINSAQSAQLARIDIVIRSNRRKFKSLSSSSSSPPDTVKVSVAPRNRAR